MTQPTYQTQEVTLDNQMYTIVQSYDLAAAVQAVQDYVQRGYEVCFNKNETYPISIGTMISFGVAKPSVEASATEGQPKASALACVRSNGLADKPSAVTEQQEAKPARKTKSTPLA
jgi:hypothetical protein